MNGIRRFEDIEAWQKARAFVSSIYTISGQGRLERDFALRDQIRKAVISVPSNIAEGFERFRPRELKQFLSIAKASCAEVRTQIYLAYDIGYIDDATLNALQKEGQNVSRCIMLFHSSIRP
jgi:four helix bundle protein